MKETMKLLLATLLAGFSFALPMQSMAQSPSDHDAVKLVLQNFLRSLETSDADLMRKTFRNDGLLIGYSSRNSKVVTRSTDEYAKGFVGKAADDEAQRKRSFEILDISENAAMGKVMLDYPTWKGVDYMALLKIDGEWKIVSKSWSGSVPAAKK
jgi:hypothetical protein